MSYNQSTIHPIDTTTLGDRLRASGLNWMNKDLDRLYVQYPNLFTREELADNRIGVHSSIVNENIELRAHIGELLKENDQLRITNGRLNQAEAHAEAVSGENKQNTITLNEKTTECNAWKSKFTAADAEAQKANAKVSVLAKENAHLYQLQQESYEGHGQHEQLKSKHSELQAEYAALTQTKDRLVILNNERETQTATAIQQRESAIASQNVTIGKLQAQVVELQSVKNTNLALKAENERLSNILGDNIKTIDGLRFGVAQLTEVESNLGVTAEERSRLIASITEKNAEIENLKIALYEARGLNVDKNHLAGALNDKLAEIDALRLQVSQLQIENSRVHELETKVALLAADNERLSVSLVEKIHTIEEWSTRYASLEHLYLHIKETTEQLDFIKRKYETVVVHTEQLDPKLKAYADLRQSTANTESSPEIQALKKSITYIAA